MLYPHNFENKIKFDKIRQIIKTNCLSEMGSELVDKLSFSDSLQWIKEQLEDTNEFMLILKHDEFPSSHVKDARIFLAKIRIDGLFLDIADMMALKISLESLSSIIHFLKTKELEYPKLFTKSKDIQLFPYILQRLNAIISKHGTIKDTASPELANIRLNLQRKQASISKRMQSILQHTQSEGWVDKDTNLTVRDGRILIPVPSAHKRKIKGIVHDESATGKTSFIEPSEIVELNNEIRELQLEEKREINRILRAFADELRPYIDDLIPAYDFLAYIDFVRAKAKFANNTDAAIPLMNEKAEMQWYNARHPLLYLSLKEHGKAIIPLKIELNEEQRIVLISGPNAGGKSVCLQTTGLLQYMFQCGIPVPVSEHSTFGVFKKILIDIGDEQSIENDLSTYSSHLINMKNFVKNATAQSLVLIDEFGTGTEPMLGGAIAESVLAELNNLQTRGVITTHYTNLKHYAAATAGITNGAMLYDNHRMLPLFELEIGKPGSSFAFEIAKKIGLPKNILEAAATKVGEEHINYDKNLKDIARDKKYWEDKRRKIHENEKRLDDIVEKYSSELNDTAKLRKEIIKEAQEKAQAIINNANKTVENTIKEIRESQAERSKLKKIRQKLEAEKQELQTEDNSVETEKIRRKMEQLKNRQERKQSRSKDKVVQDSSNIKIVTKTKASDYSIAKDDKTLNIGDAVFLPNKAVGEILSIDGDTANIALGNISMRVKIKLLKRASNNKIKKAKQKITTNFYTNEDLSQRKLEFKPDVDLRGMRAEEALERIMRHIDDAVMLNYPSLRLLHGTGTGALRHSIRQYLSTNPLIKTYADEKIQLGGAGITVIELDI